MTKGKPQTHGQVIKQEPTEDFEELVSNMKENVQVDEMHEILCDNSWDASSLDESMIAKWYYVVIFLTL